jgi:betaine-aldehyde dehydrogenase
MNPPTELFIDGAYRPAASGRRAGLVNPATEESFIEVALGDQADVDAAVQGAQRAWENGWRDLAPGKRADILFNMAREIRDNQERLARLDMTQVGKPISDARDEAEMGAKTFEYYAGAIGTFCGQTIPVARGGLDFTLREPLGVVGAIVPWNFPFAIACWKVAPALAAGNCVVLKPSELSPLTALLLGEIAHEAGLPAGVLQVVNGEGPAAGAALVRHKGVRKISFTGSTAVGSGIMAAAAANVKRVSLELGGKSPNIVFADADWQRAADLSPMSVMANAGQDCCARSRLFVERPIYDQYLERFAAAAKKIIVGDPADERTQIGPLVSAKQRDRVESFLDDARKNNATFVLGGGRLPRKGYFLEPTLLADVNNTDRCWREEIFGPVVCIRPFDDEAAMLREVNDSPYGLSGSIWTNDIRRAIRVARQVQSGVLSINSNSSVFIEAPFGGYKQSGLGRDLGMSAMEGYTELKNIYVAP